MSLRNLDGNGNQALTFSIGDSLYGINVGNILSFSDTFNDIQYSGGREAEGFLGYLDFRNTLVPVFECATSLGHRRERDDLMSLVDEIANYQKAHVDWVAALEQSITSGEPFTRARNPRMCDFGKWYYSFETRDESLRSLLDKIEEPHERIHAMADILLDMVAAGQAEEAVAKLRIEKQTTLRVLLRTLDHISEFLKNGVHPVVLHLTREGQNTWFSLVLDNIGDVIDYNSETMENVNRENSREPLEGFIRDPSGLSFMLLSLEKLHQQLSSQEHIAQAEAEAPAA